jgi:hypothetical protein
MESFFPDSYDFTYNNDPTPKNKEEKKAPKLQFDGEEKNFSEELLQECIKSNPSINKIESLLEKKGWEKKKL